MQTTIVCYFQTYNVATLSRQIKNLSKQSLFICVQSGHFSRASHFMRVVQILVTVTVSLFQAPAGTCRQVDLKFKLSRIPMGAPTPHFNKISHSDIKCLYFISLFYVLILLVAQAASQFLRIQVRPLNEAHDQQGAKQPHLQV